MNDNTFDEEKSQTKARIVMSGLVLVLMGGLYVFQPVHRAGSLVDALGLISVYGLFASVWLGFLNRFPDRWLWRRYITIASDICVVTVSIHLAGPTGAYFYPIYLWVIVGNGLRFGQRHLGFGVACALLGFGGLLAQSPYWREQAIIGRGLLFGILVLPLFYLSVLRRMKRLNERLAVELGRSQVAEKAKGDFLANMSHEIRTPLNGVLGMADILGDSELDADQRHSLDVVVRSGQSLLAIINDILDFSKIASGQMHIETVPLCLGQLIDDVCQLLKPIADEKGIGLGVELSPELPSAHMGDPTRIRQILFNLVGNAIKFTESGAVTIVVSEDDMGRLDLVVRDTGIGIPADRLSAIFEQFEQASESTSRIFGGTGLGLAICRRLANLMGGEIQVSSILGEGAEFLVKLPLPKSDVAVAAPVAADDRPCFGLHALVAEDNPVNQMVADRQLKRLSITCEIVGNGQAAVDAVNDSFDLILMDSRMPIMGGLEATRLIRQRQDALANIPIIALTADASSSDTVLSLAAGMNAHLSKPLLTDELVAVLAPLFEPVDANLVGS